MLWKKIGYNKVNYLVCMQNFFKSGQSWSCLWQLCHKCLRLSKAISCHWGHFTFIMDSQFIKLLIHNGHNGPVWVLQKGLIECRCSVGACISISFHRLSFKKGLWYTILIYISTTRIRQRNFEKARRGKMGMQIDALSICQEWCWRDVYWRKKENYLVLQSKIAHAHFIYWCAHGFKFEIKCQALICHKPPESGN